MDIVTPSPGSDAIGSLPADLRLGPVQLTVRDLLRAVEWYERSLGLVVHGREAGRAELGDGSVPTVVLHEDPEARPAGRQAGLYHYALLYPGRQELARAALRLVDTKTPIQGASDHGTHEAIYLPDADGNGIELAADRSRDQWPADLGYRGGPHPLDFHSLMATVDGELPAPRVSDGLRMGHVHLHVGDVDKGLAFYVGVLGFEERAHLGSAAFVSVNGYHHHLGFNIWRGEGVGPAPPHSVGLRRWTVELSTVDEVEEVRTRVEAAGFETAFASGGFLVRDPWEIAVAIVAAEGAR